MQSTRRELTAGSRIRFRVWDNVDYMSKPFTLHSLMGANRTEFTSECVVMQYTGMKDKNGKEIYQDDVLSHPAEKEPMFIVWHDRTAGFGLIKKGWAYTHFFHEAVDPSECTIIGNVHENPELLP